MEKESFVIARMDQNRVDQRPGHEEMTDRDKPPLNGCWDEMAFGLARRFLPAEKYQNRLSIFLQKKQSDKQPKQLTNEGRN